MEIVISALIAAFGSVIVTILNKNKKEVMKELTPNGGQSMRDLVDTMATAVIRIEDKLDSHIREHDS